MYKQLVSCCYNIIIKVYTIFVQPYKFFKRTNIHALLFSYVNVKKTLEENSSVDGNKLQKVNSILKNKSCHKTEQKSCLSLRESGIVAMLNSALFILRACKPLPCYKLSIQVWRVRVWGRLQDEDTWLLQLPVYYCITDPVARASLVPINVILS